ncbi:MAG: thiamine-phosphate kinase [Acidimicrobiales bacterium]
MPDPSPPAPAGDGAVGELAVIAALGARLGRPPSGELWLGDDTAVVESPHGPLLLAADTVVAGVHFDLRWSAPADVGWKVMAVNISDLAAMGARPHRALVSVAGPAGTDIPGLYDGLLEASAEYGCPIVGGDVTSAPVLVLTVAVTGWMPPGCQPVTRAGAAPGDVVWLTGPVGSSAAGLAALARGEGGHPLAGAHRRPRARLEEGTAALAAGASAMIDLSDGTAIDLWRLGLASGVGVELDRLPAAEGATAEEAIGGGEDYELAFTAPEGASDRVQETFVAAGCRLPLAVGRCTADGPGRVRLGGVDVGVRGWEHRF